MSMRDAWCLVLAQSLKKMRALEDAARASENVQATHDMRVACRRLKSGLRFGRGTLARKRVAKTLPALETLRDVLGAARNLDVLLAALQAYRAQASLQDRDALSGLNETWTRARAARQIALEQFLSGEVYREWTIRMAALLDEREPMASPRVADRLGALMWKQYGIVRAYETQVDDAPPQILHALRIEVKRLRYLLEFFSAPLTAARRSKAQPQKLIDVLIALQDLLGEMQDAVVSDEFVAQYLTRPDERAENQIGDAEFHALTRYQVFLRAQVALRRAQAPQFYAALVSPWFRKTLGALTARL